MHYDTKACGLRLKELRQKHSMTQEELSDKLNISLSMMSKIETGNKGVSIDLLIELAELFDVSLDYILLGEGQQYEQARQKLYAVIEQLDEIIRQL